MTLNPRVNITAAQSPKLRLILILTTNETLQRNPLNHSLDCSWLARRIARMTSVTRDRISWERATPLQPHNNRENQTTTHHCRQSRSSARRTKFTTAYWKQHTPNQTQSNPSSPVERKRQNKRTQSQNRRHTRISHGMHVNCTLFRYSGSESVS